MTRSATSCLYLLALIRLPACISESHRASDSSVPETSDASDPTDASDAGAVACAEPGVTRCASDANASEICLDGVWRRATCADDKICVLAGGAQCVDSTGDADCRDTLYCFLGCQVLHPDEDAATDACLVECFRTGTQAAQRELSDVVGCFDGNCGEGTGLDCVAERCSQDLADCYFDTKGDSGCGHIVECRLTCGDDQACAKQCGSDSTIDAQGDYAVLELCTFYACAGQDAECARRVSLANGTCAPYAKECIGLLPNTPR